MEGTVMEIGRVVGVKRNECHIKPQDCLFGRGNRCRDHVGSRRFHEVCRDNLTDYYSTNTHEEKTIIAYRVVNAIHALDGRFLKQQAKSNEFAEMDTETAIHKTKQTLRDMGKKRTSASLVTPEPSQLQDLVCQTFDQQQTKNSLLPDAAMVPRHTVTPPIEASVKEKHGFDWLLPGLDPQLSNQIISPPFVAHGGGTSDQPTLFAGSKVRVATNTGEAAQNDLAPVSLRKHPCSDVCEGKPMLSRLFGPPEASHITDTSSVVPGEKKPEDVSGKPPESTGGDKYSPDEKEAAKQLYSLLCSDEAPKFTEEDVEKERKQMTEEESLSVLQDMLGNLHIAKPVRKRVKRTVPPSALTTSLLNDMKVELDLIPEEDKLALLEAQVKAHDRAYEFSDERLERFLHSESMDSQKAARRLVTYWEERRKLFGADKYLCRMTLSEALRDDLGVLREGICHLLPGLDSSGRHLIYIDFARRSEKRQGHTLEGTIRAFWYMIEVIARENFNFILVNWLNEATLWDFDRELDKRQIYLIDNCFPIHLCAVHVCCPIMLVELFIKATYYALLDKSHRQRTLVHSVPDKKIVGVLADFGISKEVLPTEMGGDFRLDAIGWLSSMIALEELEKGHRTEHRI